MLPENEYSEIESRYYLNPQIALDESNNFIENLRSAQQQNTAQIARDTEQLGTAVSSNLGGLGGGTDYWTARYSTPQTNALVADLRATAQAAALNQALENEQAMWKKRYNDAYRAYQRRGSSRGSGGGGGGGTQSPSSDAGQGDVTTTATDLEGRGTMTLTDEDFERGGRYIQDMDINRYGGHDIIWVPSNGQNIRIPQLSDGSYATLSLEEFLKNHGGGLPFIGGE